jgi:hypothetical protein
MAARINGRRRLNIVRLLGVVRFPTGMSRQSVVYAGQQYLTLSG